nr:transposase family protein [Azospirillum canadense]
MGRRLSMPTRQELISVVRERYVVATRMERRRILDEFVLVTGYHRKHAIRLLGGAPRACGGGAGEARRVYREAERAALIVLWEAAGRICGKRLKAALPTLVEAMERHHHLCLEPEVRARLLAMSAATMDRLLTAVRKRAQGGRRRRMVVNAVRQQVKVRTFADWGDPAPGWMEADFVAHCGAVAAGSFVHTLTLTDIASGWTECVPIVVRERSLVVAAIHALQSELPFALRGLDTDNDSAFMNEALLDYCRGAGIELTRCRAYRKNDQAWVEQKNGAVVRRLVGYGRLEGVAGARRLWRLFRAARLYVNYFQPSFKLKEKKRDGARVSKRYHAPATPYERLLASEHVAEPEKERLRVAFAELDPVALLRDIRVAQAALADSAGAEPADGAEDGLAPFLAGLARAWEDGEVRPTHRRAATAPRTWRTRVDPFEEVWPVVEGCLEAEPERTARELLGRLQDVYPECFPNGQLRTLQRRVKAWRSAKAYALVFGTSRPAAA